MADTDLAVAFKLTPSLVERLDKALIELEARKDAAFGMVSFTEITKHFRDLEEKMTKKYAELEAKEKAFKQEQSDAYKLLAARESAVAAKEHDIFNRIQVLKDAAAAALSESRPNNVPPSADTDDIVDAATQKKMDSHGLLSFVTKNQKDITVSFDQLSDALKSSSDPGRLILNSLDGFYPYPPDGNNNEKDTASLRGMRQSCINLMQAMNAMLAKAGVGPDHLLTYETKQQAKSIADEWFPKLARDGIVDAANGKSLEAEAFLQLLATFRIVSEFEEDQLCKLVLAVSEQTHAPELCRSLGLAHKMPGVINELISKEKLISAVHFVHAFELVDRFPTVPLLMAYLKNLRRNLQAKRIKAPNSESVQNELKSKELAAVRDVIYCIEKYDLKADYPLVPLQRRVGQLERAQPDRKRSRESTNKPTINWKRPHESTSKPPHNRKRPHESTSKPPHNRKKRPSGGGVYGHRSRQAAAAPVYTDKRPYAAPPQESYPQVNSRQAAASVYMDRRPYAAPPQESYPHVNSQQQQQAGAPVYTDRRPYTAPPQESYPQVNQYNYHTPAPPSGQSVYSRHVYSQSAYYYPPDVGVSAGAAAPSAYSGYTSSGLPSAYQPYA